MPLAPEMPRADYDALPALNWSRLKLIGKSPAHFKHGFGDDSSGFELGTGAHCAILEPEKFTSEFVFYPGKVRRGKAWEEFETEAIRSGKTVMGRSDHEKAQRIRESVFRNSRAAELLTGGRPEFSMVWKLGGASLSFDCKGRGDYLRPDAIVDLKTTADASPKAFPWSAYKYGYFGQAAWYSDGYRTLTGEVLPFYIVAVESSAPYVTQVYRVPESELEKGREQYLSMLGKLDYCQRNNFWGGYSESPEIDLITPEAT